MLLLDWIDINKDKFINYSQNILTGTRMAPVQNIKKYQYNEFIGLYGKDLAKYNDEIQELVEFKNREIRYPDDPRIEFIDNGMLKIVQVGDWEIDIHNYNNRDLSNMFYMTEYGKNWSVIYLYGIDISKLPNILRIRIAFVEDKALRMNYKRIELIEDMLKNN